MAALVDDDQCSVKGTGALLGRCNRDRILSAVDDQRWAPDALEEKEPEMKSVGAGVAV